VPKIGAISALAVGAVATRYGGQPLAAQMATIAAFVCVVACHVNRMAALPAIAAAAIGLLVVFTSYVRGTDDVTWPESTAMIAYGLAMIATLMILVERNEEAATCE
jgi:hypothetical protein